MHESWRLPLIAIGVTLIASSGCARPPADDYRINATVEELMDSIVDPASDAIWGSVEVVATLEGTVEKQPRTDDDWKTLRRHAVSLMEAGNLLLMPGRKVGTPGEKAEDPRVDLHPDEVEALIAKDRSTWIAHAHALQDAARVTLEAIDAQRQGAGRDRRDARSGLRGLSQGLLVSTLTVARQRSAAKAGALKRRRVFVACVVSASRRRR